MKTAILRFLLLSLALAPSAMGQAPARNSNDFPLYVKVQLDNSVKLSSLKPGSVVEGNLARDVYSPDRKLFPAGSHVRLVVDQLGRKRKPPSNRWPWVVSVFLPHHENFPLFNEATVTVADGSESLLEVSLISADRVLDVHSSPAHRKKGVGATLSPASASPVASASNQPDGSYQIAGPVMSLEAREEADNSSVEVPDPGLTLSPSDATLAAGTACRILLLQDVSASRSHAGDAVQARLLEPVELNSRVVLPAGSLFEGAVLKATPPRMLSRAGSLFLAFTELKLPDGVRIPVSASLTQVELNRGSHTRMDAEGRLHGERPGAAWMLINGGVTAGIAKEVDDGTQLILEAILSSATDASTAGTARIAGTIVSGLFMLTRHGRDVILPAHTEMSLVLNRPLALSTQPIP